MRYHTISPAALSATPDRPRVQRAVGDAASLDQLAANGYEVEGDEVSVVGAPAGDDVHPYEGEE